VFEGDLPKACLISKAAEASLDGNIKKTSDDSESLAESMQVKGFRELSSCAGGDDGKFSV